MKIHVTDNGTALDLDHVLVVGVVYADYEYTKPYMYTLSLAFTDCYLVSYDTPEEAERCREKLINAWKTSKEKDRA